MGLASGLSLLRQRRNHEALVALQTALKLEPNNLRFAYIYAMVLDKQGQYKRAIQLLERLLDTHPEDHAALTALVSMCNRKADKLCVQQYA